MRYPRLYELTSRTYHRAYRVVEDFEVDLGRPSIDKSSAGLAVVQSVASAGGTAVLAELALFGGGVAIPAVGTALHADVLVQVHLVAVDQETTSAVSRVDVAGLAVRITRQTQERSCVGVLSRWAGLDADGGTIAKIVVDGVVGSACSA